MLPGFTFTIEKSFLSVEGENTLQVLISKKYFGIA
jgi:hypothetical protein